MLIAAEVHTLQPLLLHALCCQVQPKLICHLTCCCTHATLSTCDILLQLLALLACPLKDSSRHQPVRQLLLWLLQL
jgi:hypothetical protein